MNLCFTCLNCGKQNNSKGNSFTNKYCNNKCQAEHRSRLLVDEWKSGQVKSWSKIPDWVKRHLIDIRGYRCEICSGTMHHNKPIPLVVNHKSSDTYDHSESNLELICPNCRAMK